MAAPGQEALYEFHTNAIRGTMALSGSAISGVARNPRNINKSGEYVVGLLQSFSVVN
jgi:hypothetical protein